MATANYTSMMNFDIYAFVPELDEVPDELLAMTLLDYMDDMVKVFEIKLDEFEKEHDLIFHRLETRCGYYEGLQVFIEEPFLWEDWIDYVHGRKGFSDELIHWLVEAYQDHFGFIDDEYRGRKLQRRALLAYLDEVDAINEFLDSLTEVGFEPRAVLARFSNSETVYRTVEHIASSETPPANPFETFFKEVQ